MSGIIVGKQVRIAEQFLHDFLKLKLKWSTQCVCGTELLFYIFVDHIHDTDLLPLSANTAALGSILS